MIRNTMATQPLFSGVPSQSYHSENHNVDIQALFGTYTPNDTNIQPLQAPVFATNYLASNDLHIPDLLNSDDFSIYSSMTPNEHDDLMLMLTGISNKPSVLNVGATGIPLNTPLTIQNPSAVLKMIDISSITSKIQPVFEAVPLMIGSSPTFTSGSSPRASVVHDMSKRDQSTQFLHKCTVQGCEMGPFPTHKLYDHLASHGLLLLCKCGKTVGRKCDYHRHLRGKFYRIGKLIFCRVASCSRSFAKGGGPFSRKEHRDHHEKLKHQMDFPEINSDSYAQLNTSPADEGNSSHTTSNIQVMPLPCEGLHPPTLSTTFAQLPNSGASITELLQQMQWLLKRFEDRDLALRQLIETLQRS